MSCQCLEVQCSSLPESQFLPYKKRSVYVFDVEDFIQKYLLRMGEGWGVPFNPFKKRPSVLFPGKCFFLHLRPPHFHCIHTLSFTWFCTHRRSSASQPGKESFHSLFPAWEVGSMFRHQSMNEVQRWFQFPISKPSLPSFPLFHVELCKNPRAG